MDINVLQKIADTLNSNNISWGLGASSMLYFHGLVKEPNDIDVIVDEADAQRASALLSKMATSIETDDGKGKYATKYFYEMKILGQAVDLIGGYRIMRGDWIYDFPVLKKIELKSECIGESNIPLTDIEDWYVAYLIMGDPKKRTALIESYVEIQNGFKNMDQLRKAVDQIQEKAPYETEILERIGTWL